MFKLKIRYKIMLLVALMAFASLSAFAWISFKAYKEDKVAYVFEQQTSHVRAFNQKMQDLLANQLLELKYFLKVRSLKGNVSNDDSAALAIQFVELKANEMPGPGQVLLGGKYDYSQYFKFLAEKWRAKYGQNEGEYFVEPINSEYYGIGLVVKSGSRSALVLAVYNNSKLVDLMESSTSSTSLLFQGHQMTAALGPEAKNQDIIANLATKLKLNSKVSGSVLFDVEKGKKFLTSFAKTGIGEFTTVRMLPESQAFSALQFMRQKAIILVVSIFAATFVISILSSRKLTQSLKKLYESTRKIGHGDFDVKLDIKSGDEVEGLAEGFNKMAEEVKLLLERTKETTRMESELETATMVQETFFPNLNMQVGNIELAGFNEMASECGGDLCFHFERNDHFFLMIGDALGHGVGAALVTSAVSSACNLIKELEVDSPAKMMTMLNTAVYDTCKEKMWMSFFIARISKSTGQFSYCSAGHPIPYLIKKDEAKIAQAARPLTGSRGPMLGNEKGAEFIECDDKIESNEILLLFTDGLVELVNNEGKQWGENRMLRFVTKNNLSSEPLAALRGKIHESFNKFRGEVPLDDDVTYLLCQFDSPKRP